MWYNLEQERGGKMTEKYKSKTYEEVDICEIYMRMGFNKMLTTDYYKLENGDFFWIDCFHNKIYQKKTSGEIIEMSLAEYVKRFYHFDKWLLTWLEKHKITNCNFKKVFEPSDYLKEKLELRRELFSKWVEDGRYEHVMVDMNNFESYTETRLERVSAKEVMELIYENYADDFRLVLFANELRQFCIKRGLIKE